MNRSAGQPAHDGRITETIVSIYSRQSSLSWSTNFRRLQLTFRSARITAKYNHFRNSKLKILLEADMNNEQQLRGLVLTFPKHLQTQLDGRTINSAERSLQPLSQRTGAVAQAEAGLTPSAELDSVEILKLLQCESGFPTHVPT